MKVTSSVYTDHGLWVTLTPEEAKRLADGEVLHYLDGDTGKSVTVLVEKESAS